MIAGFLFIVGVLLAIILLPLIAVVLDLVIMAVVGCARLVLAGLVLAGTYFVAGGEGTIILLFVGAMLFLAFQDWRRRRS